MKQEDKKLLLKDLCARIPYGVKYLQKCQNHNTILMNNMKTTINF